MLSSICIIIGGSNLFAITNIKIVNLKSSRTLQGASSQNIKYQSIAG